MTQTRLLVTLVTAALTVVAPEAGAANGDCRLIRGAGTPSDTADDVSVCRKDTWIHRATTPIGNLAGAADASPSWNTTKPSASFQQGAGGVYLTNIIARGAFGRDDKKGLMVVEGTYKGTLDNIAIELFGFVTTETTGRLNLRLDIDDVTIFEGIRGIRDDGWAGAGRPVEYRFVYTNLYKALESISKPNDATTEHTIRVGAAGYTVGQDPIVFVYDTAEQPAGLVFNIEDDERSTYTVIDVTE